MQIVERLEAVDNVVSGTVQTAVLSNGEANQGNFFLSKMVASSLIQSHGVYALL